MVRLEEESRAKPLYRRVLIKLSGEAFMGAREYGIDPDTVNSIADELAAKQKAEQDAKAKAGEIATLAGVTLGELQSINVYSSGGPMPVYEAKGGMAASSASVPIAAGQMVIQADANLSYEIK